jgi:MoxR-like ATPase
MHPVADALNLIQDELCQVFLERRSVIEAAIITVLAKHHMYLLGLPGTGKSDLIRELIQRFSGITYFETILSKTRPDAAILGPYNLPELRDKGDFHRKTAGFLPTANFAFLDEVGKMSPTLGHDLLAIANERLYHEVNGGRSAKPVPLYSMFTASNELIVEESDDAAALWDRLLVRVLVEGIQESGNMAILLQSAVAGNDPRLTATTRTEVDFTDLADVIDNVIPAIDVPVNVIETMLKLRDEMRSAEIIVSDRRWRQCIRLLQASAFKHGRTQVDEDDIHVCRYALWDVPTQISAVERMCLSLSNPVAEKCMGILDDVEGLSRGIRERKGQSLESKAAYGTEANGKLKILISDLAQLRQECTKAGRSTSKLDEVADRIAAVRRSIYVELLEMDPATIR